jgi:hypothetical protein
MTTNKEKRMTDNAQKKPQQEVVEKKVDAVVAMTDLESDAGAGLGGLTNEDLATPRLKILMNGSEELDKDDNLKMGQIFNTVTGQAYDGKEGIVVVPCAYQRQYAEWLPVETNANHFVILYDQKTGVGSPALITLKATQLKKSRKWNSMMLNIRVPGSKGPFNPPSFSHMYSLKVKKEDNEKGKWFGWEIDLLGPVTDMQLYNEAKVFHKSIAAGEVTAKPEQDQTVGSPNPF